MHQDHHVYWTSPQVAAGLLSILSLSGNDLKWILSSASADIELGRNICFCCSQEGHLLFYVSLNEIHLFFCMHLGLILMQFFHQLY